MSAESEASRRILVADDDPAILRLVTAIVEKEGYTVVPARDGREAYQLLQKGGDFDACIFDVVMPHIQGPELVRYMKTERKLMKIPVMMMTAEQNPKLSSDSFSAGAVVFLPKPFTTSQLQTMLRMLINKSRGEQG
ncbi:MAG: response regulator [Acidobacteria bacterium]|nr:response regulator [Acidobacteriota bacterium]